MGCKFVPLLFDHFSVIHHDLEVMYIATWVIQTILHKISMYLFCLPKKSQVQKYF